MFDWEVLSVDVLFFVAVAAACLSNQIVRPLWVEKRWIDEH